MYDDLMNGFVNIVKTKDKGVVLTYKRERGRKRDRDRE